MFKIYKKSEYYEASVFLNSCSRTDLEGEKEARERKVIHRRKRDWKDDSPYCMLDSQAITKFITTR